MSTPCALCSRPAAVDIARLCSLPWANASRGGACEEDFRILTERFSDRFAPAAWPQLVAPGSALAAQAPTAHASGRRGMPGLPMSVRPDAGAAASPSLLRLVLESLLLRGRGVGSGSAQWRWPGGCGGMCGGGPVAAGWLGCDTPVPLPAQFRSARAAISCDFDAMV